MLISKHVSDVSFLIFFSLAIILRSSVMVKILKCVRHYSGIVNVKARRKPFTEPVYKEEK